MAVRLRGDFNGLFGDLLCISHSDTATDDAGVTVALSEAMEVLAFEEDVDDDGSPAFLVARGLTVRSPDSLQHGGSRWCLRIDRAGVRHVRTLDDA